MRREALESAQEAARRSGMSVGEWLDSVIMETTANTGVNPAPRRSKDADEHHGSSYETPQHRDDGTGRLIADALSRLDRRLDQVITEGRSATSDIERRVSAIDRAVSGFDREPGRPAVPAGTTPLDRAMLEIEARQRALDGEAAPARMELPRAPTQGLTDLEQQLRNINVRIESLRPCGVDRAFDALRDDLAEIGVMLKDAMPRRAIETLETEVRSLVARIDDKRHAGADGADGAAIAGIERGLAEVRDALRGLTPAENLVGFDEVVNGLAQKIDNISGGVQDPAAMKQLEGAIVGLRGIVSHVASNDALATLSDEVRALASKVEQVAGADAFNTIDRRIAAIADALQSRNQTGDEARSLETVVQGLTDKLERLSLTRADHAAVAHLEDHIVKLVEKLDASDSRLSHLESIERGLAELLIHFEHSRIPQAAAANAPEAATLKRDVQRTQDSLEAVQGTIGHVVERLATIETSMRDGTLPKAANIPEPPAAPEGAGRPTPAASIPKAVVPAGAAPAVTRTPAPAAPLGEPEALGATQNPAPADRKPIDPNLPPDHPLEPGAARGRGNTPAERIAASEAALGSARPPVIPDPGGKPNFIAAARRAAQAAIVDPPAQKDKRGRANVQAIADGSGGEAPPRATMGQRVKALIVGGSAVLLVIGTLQIAMNLFSSSASRTSDTSGAPTEEAAPVPDQPATTAGRQSAVPLERIETPIAGLPAGIALPSDNPTLAPNTTAANTIAEDTTGSVRALNSQSASVAPTGATPLPPAPPNRASGADKLPPGIGSGGLRAAAIKGDSAAEFEIATRYAEGRGVPQNLPEAAAWFERAAKQGLAPAQFRLGGLYEKGMGVQKSLETARRLYHLAADAGHAKAMHNLAVLYAEGVAGKPDYQTASRWFRRAAEHGISDSQYNLGILYARGIGVETNMAEAYKWFALASRDGDREAAKKRDDVGSRLDRQTLTAAMQAAQAWQAQPQPEAAIQVRVPSGGWDGVPAPAIVKRKVGPKTEPQ